MVQTSGKHLEICETLEYEEFTCVDLEKMLKSESSIAKIDGGKAKKQASERSKKRYP